MRLDTAHDGSGGPKDTHTMAPVSEEQSVMPALNVSTVKVVDDLFVAIDNQDVQEVRTLLHRADTRLGSNKFLLELQRKRLIHYATWNSSEKMLGALLENRECLCLINEKDEWGRTPLMTAAGRGQVGCMRTLLKAGANYNLTDNARQQTALHKAALAGHGAAVALLLAWIDTSGLEVRDDLGQTALLAAVDRGQVRCFQILADSGSDIKGRCAKQRNVIQIAASNGNVTMLKALLNRPVVRALPTSARDADGYTRLMLAVMSGNADCVRLLMEDCAGVELLEEVKYNPLYLACGRGYSAIVQLLLLSSQARALPSDACSVAAARRGDIFLEDLLVLHGSAGCTMAADILRERASSYRTSGVLGGYTRLFTKYSNTCLHLAAQSGDVRTLDIIYACYSHIDGSGVSIWCVDIDRLNAFQQTPLHLAAIAGSEACTKFLVKNGANLAARTPSCPVFVGDPRPSAVSVILHHVLRAEEILTDILDDCITIRGQLFGQQDIVVDLSMLCPAGEKRLAVVQQMYSQGDNKNFPLLKHPVIQTLIYTEWNKRNYSFCINLHFVLYLSYISMYAVYLLLDMGSFYHNIPRIFTIVLCLSVFFAALPFMILAGGSYMDRLFRFVIKIAPPILTLVALILDDKSLSSFALIFSWLALLNFTSVISYISYKFAMFQYIMKKLVDHLVVFVFILTGFSFSFYLLYREYKEGGFNTLWSSVISTTVALLQGDLSGTPLFKEISDTGVPHINLIAGGFMQQLFVVIVVLALLNMWVGLAVRGGRELERQGHVHYHRNQVRILTVLESLIMSKPNGISVLAIAEKDIPAELFGALRCKAISRQKGELNLRDIADALDKLAVQVTSIEDKLKGFIEMRQTFLKPICESNRL